MGFVGRVPPIAYCSLLLLIGCGFAVEYELVMMFKIVYIYYAARLKAWLRLFFFCFPRKLMLGRLCAV